MMTNLDISQLYNANVNNYLIIWDNISISNHIKGSVNEANLKFVDRLVKKRQPYLLQGA